MFKELSIVAILFSAPSLSLAGEFYPDKNAFPVLSKNTVHCPKEWFDNYATCRTLKMPLGYFDSISGLGFEAPVGTITDGASIPPFLIPLIGDRFNKEFSRAATLHDWYVHRVALDDGEYSYTKIQRMFYHALLDSNVDPLKAKAMFLAVLVGANKYKLRIKTPPKKCTTDTPNCLRNYDALLLAEGKVGVQPAYNVKGFSEKMKNSIESDEFKHINPLDLDALEELSLRIRTDLGLPDLELIEIIE
ncbi:MAG: DUF1353 domain-containing protein [Lentilitoribacter sp.]